MKENSLIYISVTYSFIGFTQMQKVVTKFWTILSSSRYAIMRDFFHLLRIIVFINISQRACKIKFIKCPNYKVFNVKRCMLNYDL